MGPGPYSSGERTPLMGSDSGSRSYTQSGSQGSVQVPSQRRTGQSVGFFSQVWLLLWKNLLQQKRSKLVTFLEIMLPLLGAIIMLVIRHLVNFDQVDIATTYMPITLGPLSGRALRGRTMLFSPNSTLIMNVMRDAESLLSADGVNVQMVGFASEDELVRFYRLSGKKKQENFPISVIFDIDRSASTLPSDLKYTIRPRTRDKDKWNTKLIFSFYQGVSPREDRTGLYYNRSFLYTQRVMAEALARTWTPNANVRGVSSWTMQRIPYPPYVGDVMTQILQQNFSTIIMLSFILSAIIMTKSIVYEKERQLKESMKLMGMSASAHWVSWFLVYFLYMVVASAIYVLFLCIKIGDRPAVLVYSDPSVMLVFLLIYAVSIITYCFFISTLTSKANVGAAVAGIIFFAVFFPYYFLDERYEDMSLSSKLGACLLFNMAMSYGLKTLGLYEGTGKGAQWDNFMDPASVDDNLTLSYTMAMLIIDSIVFIVLTWYIDNVNPGTYGVPRPWYFPFQSSYWCGGGRRKRTLSVRSASRDQGGQHFEREPSGLAAGISMVHLRKVFGGKVAVKDSTLTMYEGQVTVLLGHNGAGKTTTMSMLTGFLPPSSGTAYVNGYDIRTDINNVRSNLGLCPQHNILFDTLTVEEHLQFFARLKGCPKKEIASEVSAMVKEVGLETKRESFAGTLSGGQKRKLSVGIALIGGSKIVILDEPTSGMDPAARRQTWDVLQRHRAGRTMLLSTHFMDEADLLGDRIAIMAEGVVKCCGTSMFLKKLYGAGYHLVMVKGPLCDVAAVTAAIQKVVAGAQLESEVGAELSFLLPEDEASKFSALFRMVEQESRKLGINSFGATATTMEEVFLKVGASGNDGSADDSAESAGVLYDNVNPKSPIVNGIPKPASGSGEGFSNPNYAPGATNGKSLVDDSAEVKIYVDNMNEVSAETLAATEGLDMKYVQLYGLNLYLSRFIGMFVKKAIHTMRNRLISGIQLALPVIFTIAALTVDKTRPKEASDPPLTLDLGMFDGSFSSYTDGLSPTPLSSALGSNYATLFGGRDTVSYANMTQYANMTDYFLKQAAQVGVYTFNGKVLIGAQFEPLGGSNVAATAWYSGQPFHGQPVAVAYMMNAFIRQVTGEAHRLTVSNFPMPKDEVAAAQDNFDTSLRLGFSIGFSMLFGMAFLTASFSYFLIRERQTGAKHLQVVSGVGPTAYWLASLTWDLINYIIPCLLLLVVFAAFQVSAYTDDDNMAIVFLVLVVFGFSVVPFTYVLQFPFRAPATGFVALIILAIISGLFTMLTVFILRIPALDTEDVAEVLDWTFMVLFPHYNLGTAFSNFYINKLDLDFCVDGPIPFYEFCPSPDSPPVANFSNPCCKDYCADFCLPFETDYLAWEYPGIGRNVMFLCLQSVAFFVLALAIDFQLLQELGYMLRGGNPQKKQAARGIANPQFPGSSPQSEEDDDVQAERQRVLSGGAAADMLILRELYKRYGNFLAVDRLSVGVPEQECFGLLGQNGAGKTTTFKMLTGDVMLSDGDAFVLDHSIKTDIKKVQANMGYCPQFDALIDQMTGRETLVMYARLRGVPSSKIRPVVDNLITLLMLEKHADKLTMHYSGGNKRKLSTAIALVGGPAVVLLDEPSSGMDPAARRQLWNILSQVRASGRTLILTSHSMEECDALCTRLAIMVNGQFKCLGSPQHLKSKFGQGYTLVAKLLSHNDGTLASSQPLTDMVSSAFPGTLKFDDHQGYVHFQVPDASIPLSAVFDAMERAKQELGVEDYSVHQTTLEQIFLAFTRAQYPPRETPPHSIIAQICPCCR